MTLSDIFQDQILAFHAAIMDDCHRAADPEKTDAMALRLRNNALALGRLQMAMLAQGSHITPHAVPPDPVQPEPERPIAAERPATTTATATPDRILAGDALSRFASRRLDPAESPHEIWQMLQEGEAGRPRRNPALPSTGFRSPSG